MNLFRDPENVYFYIPVGSHSTERRMINEDFVTNYLRGKNVVMINSYYPMHLRDSTVLSIYPHWEFDERKVFERLDVFDMQPTWRGYNMVSQYYWLSDEEMLDKPEFIECACFSIPKVGPHELNGEIPIEIVGDNQEVIDYLEALLAKVAADGAPREDIYAKRKLNI